MYINSNSYIYDRYKWRARLLIFIDFLILKDYPTTVCPILFLSSFILTLWRVLSLPFLPHLVSLNSIAPHYTIAIGTTTITIQRPYFPVQSDLKRSSKLNLFHRIPLCLASHDQCFRLCVSIRQISRYEIIKRRILMQWMFYLHILAKFKQSNKIALNFSYY